MSEQETSGAASQTALPPMLDIPKSADFTKTEVRKFITLTVTDCTGHTISSAAGEDKRGCSLTLGLRDASEEEGSRVRKCETLTPLGQDTYEVDRDYLSGSFESWRHWLNAETLLKTLPLECCCTFIVYY
jgi:hypothetical protein